MKSRKMIRSKGKSRLDLKKFESALHEAYLQARREAFVHNVPVVLYKNGQIILEKPSALEFLERTEIEELRKKKVNKSSTLASPVSGRVRTAGWSLQQVRNDLGFQSRGKINVGAKNRRKAS